MSVNRATLIGNVGHDPRITTLVSGSKAASFTLATTERAYTKQDGTQVPEQTDWHNISVFGKLAEVAERFVRKGMQLYVSGRIRYRQYEKDGQTRYFTEIIADEFQMLGPKPQNAQEAPVFNEPTPAYMQFQQPQPQAQPYAPPQPQQFQQFPQQPHGGELPF